ncbi:hypothetical protein BASA81_010032 [Batrachochytrium salamandrivorans]|nr:hypothetical protein BASA81_010032 [Batrachochytrium salamandrivorans]
MEWLTERLEAMRLQEHAVLGDEEVEIVQTLLSLSEEARQVLARLLFLQGPWFRQQACEERSSPRAFHELVANRVLVPPELASDWTHILCNELSKPELLGINKRFNPKCKPSLAKPGLIEEISKVVNNTRTLFNAAPIPLHRVIQQQVGNGPTVVKIFPKVFTLCVRAIRVFNAFLPPHLHGGLGTEVETEAADAVEIRGGFRLPSYLSSGFALAMKLPSRRLDAPLPQLFESRLDLDWLERSLDVEAIIQRTVLRNDLVFRKEEEHQPLLLRCNNLYGLYQHVLRLFAKCPTFPQRAEHLIPFHDAKSRLSDGLFVLVEWMEKRKEYSIAVQALQTLVDSGDLHGHQKRAWWFQRLVIDLEHLKLDYVPTCTQALSELVGGEKHVLWQYFATKLKGDQLRETEIHVVVLEAKPFLKRARGAGKQLYLREEDGGEATCSVEEFAIEHYANNGGWEGHHLENYVFKLLFKLLMRPVCFGEGEEEQRMFASKLWVFNGRVVDLRSSSFSANREPQIAKRVAEIASWSCPQLGDQVGHEYDLAIEEEGGRVRELMVSRELVQRFAIAMGPDRVSRVCLGFGLNYANLGRGGAPDLLLIRGERDCKLVEVKSESDRLSEQQQYWIRFLQRDCLFEVEVLKLRKRTKLVKGEAALDEATHAGWT